MTTNRRVTINDVAKLAMVSPSAVSRYLNGKTGVLSEVKRRQIALAIDKLGYQPNQMARGLRSLESRTIGVVMADIGNPYSIAILRGVEEGCAASGYSLIVCNSNEDERKEREYLQVLESKQVDGILINTTGKNNDLISTMSRMVPMVLIDRKIPYSDVDVVTSDHAAGIWMAASHLVERGCAWVGLVLLTPGNISPRTESVNAFLSYFSGVADAQGKAFFLQDYDGAKIREMIRGGLEETPNESAIGFILGNELLSIRTLQSVHDMNLSVPDRVMLVGIDDAQWATISNPTLSVIRESADEIGRRAAQMLFRRLASKGGDAARQAETVELPVQLIERGSTNRH